MRQIEDAFNEYFCGCDINKRRDRIGVIAVMLTRYNDYDIREIRKELKELSDVLEKAHTESVLDKHKKLEHDVMSSIKDLPKDEMEELENSLSVQMGATSLKGKTKKEIAEEVAKILEEMMEEDEDAE